VTKGENMAAVAIEVSEQAKWDAYLGRVGKAPKRDRRELSRASEQTRWVMAAMEEWYEFYHVRMAALGLPSENWICRLWQPRQQFMNVVPRLPEPSRLAAAVEAALPHIRDSRRRVLLVCQQHADRGLEYSARRLGMSANSAGHYLEEARQSLADILRAGGWKVPHKP
jgi:hypothetical protein